MEQAVSILIYTFEVKLLLKSEYVDAHKSSKKD